MYDFQKANMWKRISAAMLDFFLFIFLTIGTVLLLSAILDYGDYSDDLQARYDAYEDRFGVDFDLTSEEYEALSEEEQATYQAATEALASDEVANYLFEMLLNLTLIIVTFGLLLSYLLLEFALPLFLGNGQTLGKKIFGIGVMREDGVKLSPLLLFVRTVLGKFTIETMIPVMLLIMLYFNLMGILGILVIAAMLAVQLALLIGTRARTPLHDKLAHSVTVDLASQMIFDTPEDLLAYKQKLHAETVDKTE